MSGTIGMGQSAAHGTHAHMEHNADGLTALHEKANAKSKVNGVGDTYVSFCFSAELHQLCIEADEIKRHAIAACHGDRRCCRRAIALARLVHLITHAITQDSGQER